MKRKVLCWRTESGVTKSNRRKVNEDDNQKDISEQGPVERLLDSFRGRIDGSLL
ncbi:MAG: hypothetical protein ACLTSG_06375 [Lachnospiraceae bacterium]